MTDVETPEETTLLNAYSSVTPPPHLRNRVIAEATETTRDDKLHTNRSWAGQAVGAVGLTVAITAVAGAGLYARDHSSIKSTPVPLAVASASASSTCRLPIEVSTMISATNVTLTEGFFDTSTGTFTAGATVPLTDKTPLSYASGLHRWVRGTLSSDGNASVYSDGPPNGPTSIHVIDSTGDHIVATVTSGVGPMGFIGQDVAYSTLAFDAVHIIDRATGVQRTVPNPPISPAILPGPVRFTGGNAEWDETIGTPPSGPHQLLRIDPVSGMTTVWYEELTDPQPQPAVMTSEGALKGTTPTNQMVVLGFTAADQPVLAVGGGSDPLHVVILTEPKQALTVMTASQARGLEFSDSGLASSGTDAWFTTTDGRIWHWADGKLTQPGKIPSAHDLITAPVAIAGNCA